MIYLQSECIEKYLFKSCSKYDRDHDSDVIFRQVTPFPKLRCICRKHKNDVAQQLETPGESTIFVARQIHFVVRHNLHVAQRLHYSITVKHFDTTKDAFLA